ncbi:MAG: ATP-dependent 6-phosphofructokinase [Candidatus Peribacteraceae bacterium]|nr:ATP-dependent 6-phosphofructokinase [Candidatus Peribacteraceae bacterium]
MKIAIMTSGGDAPGMNAAIRSVVRTAIYRKHEVIGIQRGYLGLINRESLPLNSRLVGGILNRGGIMLLTARAPIFEEETAQDKAIEWLRSENVDCLIIIGGNGSQQGSYQLHKKQFPVVGIASTIDNDVYGSDQTIGFDTALNNAIGAIDKIRDTATSHERVFIIEVMGRDVGFIALHCGIAVGSDEIIIPEVTYDIERLSHRIKHNFNLGKKHFIIVIAEGSGTASELSKKIKSMTDIEPRYAVLGYIQRGGDPTYIDRFLATSFGYHAVLAAESGDFGKVIGLSNNEIVRIPLEITATHSKQVNKEIYEDMINALAI